MSKPIGKHTPGPWSYRAAQKGFGDERLDTGIFAEIDGANRIIAECSLRLARSIIEKPNFPEQCEIIDAALQNAEEDAS